MSGDVGPLIVGVLFAFTFLFVTIEVIFSYTSIYILIYKRIKRSRRTGFSGQTTTSARNCKEIH